MNAQSAIVMTHKRRGEIPLPHLKDLKISNPDVDVHVLVGEDSGRGKNYDWKNSDQQLRKWWKENSDSCAGDVIAILEWDTLVQIPLPSIPEGVDLAGALVMREDVSMRDGRVRRMMADPMWCPQSWFWWGEVHRLGIGDQPAVGLVSFGCMLIRREYLDAVCDSRWDAAYSQSVQNELRFPTVVSASGGVVGEIDLPGVHHCETAPDGNPGIWHGVKECLLDLQVARD